MGVTAAKDATRAVELAHSEYARLSMLRRDKRAEWDAWEFDHIVYAAHDKLGAMLRTPEEAE